MNTCQRCGRELKDPGAMYGWRCAEILEEATPRKNEVSDWQNPLDYGPMTETQLELYAQMSLSTFLRRYQLDKSKVDYKNLLLAWKQQISAKMFRNVQAWFGEYQNALRAANATYDAATQTIRLQNGAIITD